MKFDKAGGLPHSVCMKTIQFSVTDRQAKDMAEEIRTGRYRDVSELLREAWRVWEEREIQRTSRELVTALQSGRDRDPSKEEMAEILAAQKRARAKRRRAT